MKPRIALTRRFPESLEKTLTARFDLTVNSEDHILSGDALAAHCKGADAIIVSPTERIDAEFLRHTAHHLRVVATFSVGYDHIDLVTARAYGIAVSNTPDVLTEATADIAMLCLLGASRRAREWQCLLYGGHWDRWSPTQMLGTGLSGKRLGILGLGRIGLAMAHRARAFGLTIHYHARRPNAGAAPDFDFIADFEGFLRRSDFLSLHAPSTMETRGILNGDAIEALPPGAIVVNTARGDLIDDDALIAALRSHKIAAAGLDVFRNEPRLDPRYLELPNVFLLPHIGSATLETRDAMGAAVFSNISAHFDGLPMPNAVLA